MSSELAQRARALFLEALEHRSHTRAAFIARCCGPDAALRAAVDRLLAADRSAGAFLEPPARPPAAGFAPLTGRIDRFELVSLLGVGGMGAVYLARQDHPRREVALKILHAAPDGSAGQRRLLYEAEVLARLQHPGIAQVYAAGMFARSDHAGAFIAMEYVPQARAIDAYAAECATTPAARLALFEQVCAAVQHGHEKGVIHRDLKPRNILVTADGAPKVIDFGIALAAGHTPAAALTTTRASDWAGTLRYMSPEQLDGDAAALDTRSDVYALGVVLYELLAGRSPYPLATGNVFDLPQMIRRAEPAALELAPRRLARDADAVIRCAMAKMPAERYATAGALAADVRRIRLGEPPLAARERLWTSLRRLVARHRVAFRVALVLAVTLGISGITLGWAYDASRRAEQRIRAQAGELLRTAYLNAVALAHAAWRDGNTIQLRSLLDGCPTPLRNWEWRFLDRLADRRTRSFVSHSDGAAAVWSPDGNRFLSYSYDRTLCLWDAASGRVLVRSPMQDDLLMHATFAPDGRRVAWVTRSGRLRIGRVGDFAVQTEIAAHHDWANAVAFTPAGDVITVGADGRACGWDGRDGAARFAQTLSDQPLDCLAVAPDGSVLAVAGWDGRVRLLAPDGAPRGTLSGHGDRVVACTFSPDGARLATASWDGTLRLWDLATGSAERTVELHIGRRPVGLAFSPDGARLAMNAGLAVRVWDVATWEPETPRLGGTSVGGRIAWSPDGRWLLTGSRRGVLDLWDARPYRQPRVLREHGDLLRDLALAANDRVLALAGRDGVVLTDLAGTRVWPIADSADEEPRVALAADGSAVLIGGAAGTLALHADDGTCRWRRPAHRGRITVVGFLAGGARVVSAGWDGRLVVADQLGNVLHTRAVDPDAGRGADDGALGAGEVVAVATAADDAMVDAGATDPAGALLALATRGGTVTLWSGPDAQPAGALAGGGARFVELAFSADGRLLAGACADGLVYVWDVAARRLVHRLPGHLSFVLSVAFSPDGTRLVSGGYDGQILLWDVPSGRMILALSEHASGVTGLAFSADGASLLSASNDRTVRIWSGE